MRSIKKHYQCGRHSGFPECCIDFYINHWINLKTHETTRDEFVCDIHFKCKYSQTLWKYNEDKFIGYIPCPNCFYMENFVEVKNCDCKDIRLK